MKGHGVQSPFASRRMHIYVLSVVCYVEFESSKWRENLPLDHVIVQ